MGWWSATIMGGDWPLDCLGNLAEVCGVKFDTEQEGDFHCYMFTRASLESSIKKINKLLRKNSDDHILGQVVGATFMWAGAPMSEALKSRAVSDARKDEWAAEGDEERQGYIDDFIKKVEAHEPGKQTELVYQSLGDRFRELADG